VVELSVSGMRDAGPLLERLRAELVADHLQAVPVGRLMRDAASV
jgi:hypothetical protein